MTENDEDGPPKFPKMIDGPNNTLFDIMFENGYIKTLEFNQIYTDYDYCIAIIKNGFAEFKLNDFQFWKPNGSSFEHQGPPKKSFGLQYL